MTDYELRLDCLRMAMTARSEPREVLETARRYYEFCIDHDVVCAGPDDFDTTLNELVKDAEPKNGEDE